MGSLAEQSKVAPVSGATRPRRRLWHRLLRWTALLALLAAVAYATLPWWLPADALRNYFAGEMLRQMNVPVTIDRLSYSWQRGLEIDGLKIASEPAFGSEPVVDVAHLHADFSPLTYLVSKKLAWMEINNPRLSVRFDRDGNCNLAVLSRLPNDVTTKRISIHQADLTVRLPQEDRPLRLVVADMQVRSGHVQFGQVTMSAAMEQPPVSDVPVGLRWQAEPGAQREAAFSFTNIHLEQLPLVRLLNLSDRVERLGGGVSGKVELRMNSQGLLDHVGLGVTVRGLDLALGKKFPSALLAGKHLPVIDNISLDAAARVDPLTGKLDIDSFRLTGPGLDLSGRAALVVSDWSLLLTNIVLIDLDGRVEPSELASCWARAGMRRR